MPLITKETPCKSALTNSGIPGIDYVCNPYTGCAHACLYCYASFMKRFTGHEEPWGEFLDAKINIAECLARQLRRPKAGNLLISSVTDPYQPAERDYGLTRSILQQLAGHEGLEVSILTKSDLVLRDADLIKGIPRADVGFTITSADDRVSRLFEPGASPVTRRLDALRRLNDAGIRTWAFIAPVLPYFSDSDEALGDLFDTLARTGVGKILVDRFNPYPAAIGRVMTMLKKEEPAAIPYFRMALEDPGYREDLRKRVQRLAAGTKVPVESFI